MSKTKKICLTGILTALYCVLSAMMRFTVIGNIQVDLGYIALAVACFTVGPWAAIVGAVGCGLESILFSAYGFSLSWFMANFVIGLICGYVFQKFGDKPKMIERVLIIAFAVFLGMLCVKTPIECYLYHIPFAVKALKNGSAAAVDSLCMVAGMLLYLKTPLHNIEKIYK